MDFTYNDDDLTWDNEGYAPSDELKSNGFSAGYKPPASIFNWFWCRVGKFIEEAKSLLAYFSVNDDGGVAAGDTAECTGAGVAGGHGAISTDGGVAIGNYAKTESGGAIGSETESTSGFAGGYYAKSTGLGAAAGNSAWAYHGGAVGSGAKAQNGFSGGNGAKVKNNGSVSAPNYIDAIQLGTGTNSNEGTLQVYDYQVTARELGSHSSYTYWLNDVGKLSDLETEDKTSIVAAVNETVQTVGERAVHYGVCATAKDTAAKTVEIDGFALYDGAVVMIKFTYGLAGGAEATLNINSTGAKVIGVNAIDTLTSMDLDLGEDIVLTLVYDSESNMYVMTQAYATVAEKANNVEWSAVTGGGKTIADNCQTYSTTPVQIGTWADGSAVYRAAGSASFTDLAAAASADTDDAVTGIDYSGVKAILRQTFYYDEQVFSSYRDFCGTAGGSSGTVYYIVEYVVKET